MTGATVSKPLPVRADRAHVERAIADAYNAVEEYAIKIGAPDEWDDDGLGESREVTAEHVAELATLLDTLDLELPLLAKEVDRLRDGLRWLVWARVAQEPRGGRG